MTSRTLRAAGIVSALAGLLLLAGSGSAALVTINGRIAVSLGGAGSRISTAFPDGSGVTPFTSNAAATDREPAWSPDGSRIAFAREKDLNGLSDILVASVNPETGVIQGNPVPLTPNGTGSDDRLERSPTWSPDGSRIAYAGATVADASVTEVNIMNANGSGNQKMTSDGDYLYNLAWSPDGTRIALARQFPGKPGAELAIYNVATAQITSLKSPSDPDYPGLTATSYDRSPSWSPDGSRIAYTHVRNGVSRIAIVSGSGQSLGEIAGGPGTGAPQNVGAPEWSPDGTRIAYVVGSKELWTIAPDGSGVVPRVWTDPKGLSEPSWLPRLGYPAPAIVRATPAGLMAGSAATTVTVSGGGFIAESVARWRGEIRASRVIDPNTIAVELSAADLATAGVRELSVTNPGPGGGTARINLTVTPQGSVSVITVGSKPRPLEASLKFQVRSAGGKKLAFQRLRVLGPKGAKVVVKCTPTCGKPTRTIGRKGFVDLAKVVGTKGITTGWHIEVRVTKSGAIGRLIRYTLKERNRFDGRICRLPIGRTQPTACKAI